MHMNYKAITGWIPSNKFYNEYQLESLYMETQGNYNAFHDTYIKWANAHMGLKQSEI